MNRGIISIGFLLGSLCGFAAPHGSECRVVTVNQHINPWEEGLGVFGDPESDSDSQNVSFEYRRGKLREVRVGQVRWSTARDAISRKDSQSTVDYLIHPKGSEYSVLLKVYRSERGVVLYKEGAETSWQMVGTFDCSSVVEVEKAAIGSASVHVLSATQVKKLSKSVRDNLDKVDLAFELGDGYYDLKASRIYEVTSRKSTKQTAGYLMWGRLHFTEDNEDIEVLVRFDRNGLRLGEIER